ncbi:MAG: dihydrofolate reductase family protein [Gammaproteobacteria bacterium]|jgi:dihydrofolate reductase
MNILYIATSIDGYIAKPDGSVDWLSVAQQEDEDYGYNAFYDSIDALVMGSHTYQQLVDADKWPYENKPSYVMSDQALPRLSDEVRVVSGSAYVMQDLLVEEQFERVWLVGGGKLASAFQHARLIDEYIISVIPVILGNGIPLFDSVDDDQPVDLTETKRFGTGVVQLHYSAST